jgi:hypothetical protein
MDQVSTFYRLWTLKEAYLKGTGQGLAAPLDGFAFRLDPLAISVGGQDPMADWQFAEFRPGPAHSLSLAVQSPGPIEIDDAPMTRRDCLDYAMHRAERQVFGLPYQTQRLQLSVGQFVNGAIARGESF